MKTLKNKLHQLLHPAKRQSQPTTTGTKGKSTLQGGVKRGFRVYATIVAALTVFLSCGVTAFAAGGDPLQTVNNLSEFIFGLIRAIGLILLGFGIVQIGLSLKGHDPSQRANGFMTFAGGIVIFFAKEILNLITGA
jgi:hypothetical protein